MTVLPALRASHLDSCVKSGSVFARGARRPSFLVKDTLHWYWAQLPLTYWEVLLSDGGIVQNNSGHVMGVCWDLLSDQTMIVEHAPAFLHVRRVLFDYMHTPAVVSVFSIPWFHDPKTLRSEALGLDPGLRAQLQERKEAEGPDGWVLIDYIRPASPAEMLGVLA